MFARFWGLEGAVLKQPLANFSELARHSSEKSGGAAIGLTFLANERSKMAWIICPNAACGERFALSDDTETFARAHEGMRLVCPFGHALWPFPAPMVKPPQEGIVNADTLAPPKTRAKRVLPVTEAEHAAITEEVSPEKLSPEAVREEAIEAAELVGLIEPQAEPEEPVPTDEPEDDDAEGLAEISEHQDALDAAMDRVDAAAGLPEELQTLINATDTVETWQAVKDAFATFQGTDLWKSLRPEQQNHIRRSTWETLSDREISWLPDRRTDISAFRLWLETVDEWEAVEGGFTTLQGDPGYQAKSDALKGQIGDAVKARIAALKGGA